MFLLVLLFDSCWRMDDYNDNDDRILRYGLDTNYDDDDDDDDNNDCAQQVQEQDR
jgi:hypothetical protein